jgi:hypothetical protein
VRSLFLLRSSSFAAFFALVSIVNAFIPTYTPYQNLRASLEITQQKLAAENDIPSFVDDVNDFDVASSDSVERIRALLDVCCNEFRGSTSPCWELEIQSRSDSLLHAEVLMPDTCCCILPLHDCFCSVAAWAIRLICI